MLSVKIQILRGQLLLLVGELDKLCENYFLFVIVIDMLSRLIYKKRI